jgi:hypothetical protein
VEADVRSQDRAGQDVPEDERLTQAAREEGEDGGNDDAEADGCEEIHEAAQYSIVILAPGPPRI